ncbi:MAG: hypothetical protein AB9846_17460 [Tenuifilaceae bacterium]
MRKNLWIRLSILIIIIGIISTDCTKDYSYIEKYLGNWEFKTISIKLNLSLSIEYKDSIIFNGVISHGNGRDEVLIQNTEESIINFEVNEDGTLVTNCRYQTTCSGKFSDENNFHYRISSTNHYSNGYYWMYITDILGNKLSED